MNDALRLAFGTMSALPVRPPRRVDRSVAGWAMGLGPLVGTALGLGGLVATLVLREVFAPLLVAAIVVGVLGVATRLIHWDGLADTADGLGSGKEAEGALEIMRRSDIGPFGVFAIVLVFALQVGALTELLAQGAVGGVLVGVVLGRGALVVACRRGVPAARGVGLGWAVAGSVGVAQMALGAGVAVLVAALVVAADPGLGWLSSLVAVVLAVLWALAATAYLRRRLGGMSGDTLGALVETTTAVALVALAA
ncbi:MAG TPA: adenosylcobinamide-GDP ribazoletransferase [Nocardioidaceae bacterium]|nr:adenosylcobinamide-GDP ribazoletransferase [Nocardioidaceae bacterium]